MKKIGENSLHLLITALVGAAFWAIGELLYPSLFEKIWTPLGMAVYILIFGIIVFVAMFVLNQVRRDYSFWKQNNKMDDYKKSYRLAALFLVFLFLAGMLFEFLYELGRESYTPPTSYVFLIDDSGSTASTDPDGKRIQAVKTILDAQEPDFKYAVYRFTNDAERLEQPSDYMDPENSAFESDGGTNIIHSLNTVLIDIENSRIDGGPSPKILLFSDGQSSGNGANAVVKKLNNLQIAVSSVALGGGSSLLKKISGKTGGAYIQVDDVNDLPTQMENAITSWASRNLLSERYVSHLNWLYAVLRIVFLVLLGILWSAMKYFSYFSAKGASMDNKVFLTSVALTTASSVLTELLFQTSFLSGSMIRLLFCVAWAITPGYFIKDLKTAIRNGELTTVFGDSKPFEEELDSNILLKKEEQQDDMVKTLTDFSRRSDSNKPAGSENNHDGGFAENGSGFRFGGSFGSSDGFDNTSKWNQPGSGWGDSEGGFRDDSDSPWK